MRTKNMVKTQKKSLKLAKQREDAPLFTRIVFAAVTRSNCSLKNKSDAFRVVANFFVDFGLIFECLDVRTVVVEVDVVVGVKKGVAVVVETVEELGRVVSKRVSNEMDSESVLGPS